MKRKRPTSKPRRPETLLGKRYAEALRERAQLMRTDLLLTKKARGLIADDLEALAQIAETTPESFRGVK